MIEVLKQALTDAKRNERHNNVAETRYWLNQYKLIAEQAIAELESQEPVAWVQDVEFEQLPEFAFSWVKTRLHDKPLYTHPPQRTWVGLSEQQRNDIENDFEVVVSKHVFNAIEAKLKEKNT
jgi:hypothetical protein